MELFFKFPFLIFHFFFVVYENTSYFCMLILYPATLLNCLISSNGVLGVESLGFYTHEVILSVNRDNFTTSFSIWMPFISSSCQIALVILSILC